MAKELLLMTDVDGLGREADIVKVADGYARNYLVPKKLAVPVTKSSLQQIERTRKEREERLKTEIEAARGVAATLEGASCTITVKTGDNDKLFGSVTSNDIAASLKEQGFEIDKKKIVLEEPIKELGVFDIRVRLHHDVETTVKTWVVEE